MTTRHTACARCWLGVDVGTTVIKVSALNPDSGTTTTAAVPTPADLTPDGILAAVIAALAKAIAAAGDVRVEGLAFGGFAESGVLLTQDGPTAMPVVPWYDRRGESQVRALPRDLSTEFVHRTGLYLDAQASLAKLLWWLAQGEQVPAGSRWLSVPEWLAYRLCGQIFAEPSLASRTGLLDVDAVAEWGDFLTAVGLPSGLLPPLRQAGDAWGVVPDAAAREFGIEAAAGAAVTVSGHDHMVAAVAVGCTGVGDLFNSAGTSDVLVRAVPAGTVRPSDRERLAAMGIENGCHVLPGCQTLIGGVRAGLTLRRLASLLGVDDELDREALETRAASLVECPPDLVVDGVTNDVDEVVVRLRDGATPAALWLAGARAAAAETARLAAQLEQTPQGSGRAVAAGGWTRSRTVRRAKSEVLPGLEFSDDTQPGATGGALLAGHAACHFDQSLAAWVNEARSAMKSSNEESR